MNKEIAEIFLGKEVVIYPSDSDRKQGIVKAVSDGGVVFEITRYTGRNDYYVVGKNQFISFASNLSFREV